MSSIHENKKFLTTKEVAERLNVTEKTIYNYVSQGKITPHNHGDWHIDGKYIFENEQIDWKKLSNKKPGLTTGDVAKKLGVSQATVLNYIKENKLKSFNQLYKGKNTYFITDEDYVSLKNSIHKKAYYKRKTFYNKKRGYCLYQPLEDPLTREIARITVISDKEILATHENGMVYQIENLKKVGFKPLYKIKEMPYITKKGYAKFCFPKPARIDSLIYKLFDNLYQSIGPLNMQIIEQNDFIYLETKSFMLKNVANTFHGEQISITYMLQEYLTEGRLNSRDDFINVESDYDVIQFYVPSKFKEFIKMKAADQNLTIEDFVIKILKQGLTKDK